MSLAVGHTSSRLVWEAIETSLGSSTRARALGLFSQLQGLRQGDMTTSKYLGRAKVVIEDLALAGRPVSLDEQNLYIFRGLRSEYKAMVSSLTTKGTPIMISQLSDYLTTQQFIYANDFAVEGSGPVAMAIQQGAVDLRL